MNLIYLDNASTTPIDSKVLEYMMPFLKEQFGNASSTTHFLGRNANAHIAIAREIIARSLNSESSEITFTSGATESINIALQGIWENYQSKSKRIILSSTEHSVVIETCKFLEKKGAELIWLSVNREGEIDLIELEGQLKKGSLLTCVMYANNETGTINPIEKIGALCSENNSIFFCDATQAFGKINIDVVSDNIHALSVSSHKIYGPKGAGALFLKRKNPRIVVPPLFYGGSQEKGLRGGTMNVAAIAGFGKAAEIAVLQKWEDALLTSKIRTRIEGCIGDLGNVYINGSFKNRLPNISNLQISGINATSFLKECPELAFSLGAACSSDNNKLSHVLKGMGLSDDEARSSVRLSFGRFNTLEEAERVIEILTNAIAKLRSL